MTTVPTSTPTTLCQLFSDAIAKFPDRIAFVEQDDQLSFAEVGKRAERLAGQLRALGLEPGDRVAVMLRNCLAFPVSSIALSFAGLVQVNVNPMYSAPELRRLLADSGASAIILDSAAVPTLDLVIAETEVEHVLVNEGFSAGYTSLATAFEHAPLAVYATSFPDDLVLLQYTGGTTGDAKAAMLLNRNLIANVGQVWDAIHGPLQGYEQVLTALPLYHIFAFTVNFTMMFSKGATNHLVRSPGVAEMLIAPLLRARITFMTGVNTLYQGLLENPMRGNVDWSGLKVAIGGGSAIIPATSEAWRAMTGNHIMQGYGMTETSPVLTTTRPEERGFSGTVGQPLVDTDIRLFEPSGEECPPGKPGEIGVKGPQVMPGYWKRESSSFFNAQGYFLSGDIGEFDSAGRLKLLDRQKDVILVSGFNVYPNEVEAVASQFFAVRECVCVGVPSTKTGEEVVLYIACHESVSFNEDDFNAHCQANLAKYKFPRQIRIVPELPKSNVGKLLRWKVREWARS